MSLAIKVENLSKAYQLGQFTTRTLSWDIERWWARVRGKEDPFLRIGETNDRSTKGMSNVAWALKDINFEIEQGNAVGIIGKNGAGKSTLLKLLSMVTSPTTGTIKSKGRIASLLEVGTGFHRELTGRENIYLNGAILGMRKREIESKFDEIVDFSGVERYIDTPVKRYSSGMYVRLAFAVAAHLESEILIVDEVLAVGDVEFQKKCLGKMGDISKGEGRTILFVSHNMAAIASLCARSMVLENGKVSFEGEVENGINYYLKFIDRERGFANLQNKKSSLWKQNKVFSTLISIETLDQNDKRQSTFQIGSKLKITLTIEIYHLDTGIEFGIFIKDPRQATIGLLSSAAEGFKNIKLGVQKFYIEVPSLNLMPGEYSLGAWIVNHGQVDDALEDAVGIDVISASVKGNFVDFNRFKGYGYLVRSEWTLSEKES